MNTIATAVTGARHQRASRNGQDAAFAWSAGELAVAVVCDGCSSGGSSEVGARLGAVLFGRLVAARLGAGERPSDRALWDAARVDAVRALAELVERVPGDRTGLVCDQLLFTIVAAAATRDEAAVWALGDGAYSFGDRTRVLGPFDDNAPPYLAYDLLGDARDAHLEIAPESWRAVVVATDGATELDSGLEPLAAPAFLDHPDALRRHLALRTRPHERIDWDERRVVRTPARLQDDCAIAIVRRRLA